MASSDFNFLSALLFPASCPGNDKGACQPRVVLRSSTAMSASKEYVVQATEYSIIPSQSQASSCPPSSSYLPLLHCTQIPSVYKEPFIINHYRKPDCSFADCVRYGFVWHNDVWNFWTHFVPLWVWLTWLYALSYQYDFTDSYYYPLLCFWFGGCIAALFSSMAHMFGCKSFTVRTVCFMVDYLGISILFCGGGISALYYQQPLSSPLWKYEWILLTIHVVFSLNATFLSSLSRFFWEKYRFVIRAMAFLLPYMTYMIPFTLRFLTCITLGEDCISETLPYHFLSIVVTWILFFFFVSKIPERFAPGKYDIIGQSHTLFHICAVALTSIQMYMFPIDAEIRKKAILKKVTPTLETTLFPYLIVIVVGMIQVGVLGILVVKRVLISNKGEIYLDVVQREHLQMEQVKRD